MWRVAIAEMAFGGLFFLAASLLTGRIRFAYFDREGRPQESADEVVTNVWKPGDDCLAVFHRSRPDLATMRPVTALPGEVTTR